MSETYFEFKPSSIKTKSFSHNKCDICGKVAESSDEMIELFESEYIKLEDSTGRHKEIRTVCDGECYNIVRRPHLVSKKVIRKLIGVVNQCKE